MDNYQISKERAQTYFLGFDQEQILRDWPIQSDGAYLYVDFFQRPYRISRSTGAVTRLWDGTPAGHNEVLSIFDFLCHPGGPKVLSGKLAPVNSLKGRPRAAAVGTDFHSRSAAAFDAAPEEFARACLALGAERVAMGDMGFRFRVFQDFSVVLKFYHSDEDFPASVTLLWDENALEFLYYETVFFVAGFLLGTIFEQM